MNFKDEYEHRNDKYIANQEEGRRLAICSLGFICGVCEGIVEGLKNGERLTKNVLDQIDVVTSATIFLVDACNEDRKETENEL